MIVRLYSPEEIEADGTGVVAMVYPFDDYSSQLVVRHGVVDLCGSAYLSPTQTRQLAVALNTAAQIAEGTYKEELSNG